MNIRDDHWLLARLDNLWTNYFADVKQVNRVYIKFGRRSKLRLGSIKYDRHKKSSYITITSLFRDPQIPVEVVDHTIAHELIHYTHGFSSPHERQHRYPHSGGVVKQEMEARGMLHLHQAYKQWVKGYRQLLRKLYHYR